MAESWPLDHQGTPSVWEIASGDLWYGTGARLHALWKYEGRAWRDWVGGRSKREEIDLYIDSRSTSLQAIILQSKTQPRKRQRPRDAHTHGETPRADTAKSWLLASKEERPHQKPTLLAPRSWTSSLRNCEEIHFSCLCSPVCAILL